jgi:hypothetical protein
MSSSPCITEFSPILYRAKFHVHFFYSCEESICRTSVRCKSWLNVVCAARESGETGHFEDGTEFHTQEDTFENTVPYLLFFLSPFSVL